MTQTPLRVAFTCMLVCAPFLLAGCGDGWEPIRTDTVFPYGNQRTAGSTIAYVQAQMMPERTLNLEPAQPVETPPPPAIQEEPEVVEEVPAEPPVIEDPQPDMEEIFDDAQMK